MGDLFAHAAVIWFIIGFVLFLFEFAFPGFILFFFGVGAWITAILSLSFDLSVNTQIIIFVVSSIIAILLLRRWVKRILWKKNHSTELMEDEFLGKTGQAISAISPAENGKIDFKGTTWPAASDDFIEAGEIVIITGNDSILLKVKKSKPL
jgi:membrane protein implicated in regulation of membrane protease activity